MRTFHLVVVRETLLVLFLGRRLKSNQYLFSYGVVNKLLWRFPPYKVRGWGLMPADAHTAWGG